MCIMGFLFIEGGWGADMSMIDFLVSIGTIYWGFTLCVVAYELQPGSGATLGQ